MDFVSISFSSCPYLWESRPDCYWLSWRRAPPPPQQGSLFHSLRTLCVKKFLWMSRPCGCLLYNLYWCPLNPWSLETSVKNLDETVSSLPVIIVYTSIKSLQIKSLLLFARVVRFNIFNLSTKHYSQTLYPFCHPLLDLLQTFSYYFVSSWVIIDIK